MSEVKIVEEENDFPIVRVTRVVVGSAHAQSRNEQADTALRTLLQKLVDRYPGDGPNHTVELKAPE